MRGIGRPHPRRWDPRRGPGSGSALLYVQVWQVCVQTSQSIFWRAGSRGAWEADRCGVSGLSRYLGAHQACLAGERSGEGTPLSSLASPTPLSLVPGGERAAPCQRSSHRAGPSLSQALTAGMGSRRGRPQEPVCSGSVA